MGITVYTTQTCPYCRQVKEYLRSRSIAFEERDVSRDPAAAEEMVRLSGQQGVPVTVIDGTVIVGYDRPRLDAALGLRKPRLGAAVADAPLPAGQAGRPAEMRGALIGHVRPDSVADRAGLQAGDIIISLGRHKVSGAAHLEQLIGDIQPGSQIPVVYLRDGRAFGTTLVF